MGVNVAVAMAAVDGRNPETDFVIVIGSEFTSSVMLTLILVASVLGRATVTTSSSLPCSGRLIVTKDMTDSGVNELDGMSNEICIDVVGAERAVKVATGCTELVTDSLKGVVVGVGLVAIGTGGDGRGCSTGREASSPTIGFAWFCPGRGLFTMIAGTDDGTLELVATIGGDALGTSPMFEIS